MKGTFCFFLCGVSVFLTYSVVAQADYHLNIIRSRVTNDARQTFLCAVPYTVADCEKQVVMLQTTLHRYQAEKLGQWTWVLVRSEDWKPILERVHMDPNSPAFSILERRQTFFEDALLVPNPKRQNELMSKWGTGLDRLLDLAITHELGHAVCNDSDETRADQFGKRLRQRQAAVCDITQRRP
jgi:hypothetical protein